MTKDGRHSDRILVHVARFGAIALSPKAVVTATEPVVAQERHQRALPESERLQTVQDAPHVQVQGRYGSKVALEHLTIPKASIGQRRRPRVPLLLRAGSERTVIVRVDDVLRVSRPRTVGRSIMDAQIEGDLVRSVDIQKPEGIVGDAIGDIARFSDELTIPDHRRVVVRSATPLMHVPVIKPVLPQLAGPEMPLATDPADPTVGRQHIGVTDLVPDILGGVGPDVPLSDPIVNAMLRGNPTREIGGAAGRADGRRHEKVTEPRAFSREAIDTGRPNLVIVVASCRPDSLIIGQYHDDIRPVLRHNPTSFCLPL